MLFHESALICCECRLPMSTRGCQLNSGIGEPYHHSPVTIAQEGYMDPIVGYYVSGPFGRLDFQTRAQAQAQYDALEGKGSRAIGRWRQRTAVMPHMYGDEVTHVRQRSRYGDLIEKDDNGS